MENSDIYRHVDHTLLKADAAWEEISSLCREAVTFRTASVCVPPSYVRRIRENFPGLRVCAVIGFPLGYSMTAVKEAETRLAMADGANEADAVVNLGWVKDGRYGDVADELRALRRAAGSGVLKIIIETCYLDETQKIRLCKLVTESGADYIKTSTGFGPTGANMPDIELFKAHIGPGVKIKAAGGIKTKADMEAYLAAGCDRLGTSSAVKILSGSLVSGSVVLGSLGSNEAQP